MFAKGDNSLRKESFVFHGKQGSRDEVKPAGFTMLQALSPVTGLGGGSGPGVRLRAGLQGGPWSLSAGGHRVGNARRTKAKAGKRISARPEDGRCARNTDAAITQRIGKPALLRAALAQASCA